MKPGLYYRKIFAIVLYMDNGFCGSEFKCFSEIWTNEVYDTCRKYDFIDFITKKPNIIVFENSLTSVPDKMPA